MRIWRLPCEPGHSVKSLYELVLKAALLNSGASQTTTAEGSFDYLQYSCVLFECRSSECEVSMSAPEFRIESSHPIVSTLPRTSIASGALVHDCDLAVSIAAKCVTNPPGGTVRVVHVPTGEVVFSKVSEWGALSAE
jgi:hypothetical protein